MRALYPFAMATVGLVGAGCYAPGVKDCQYTCTAEEGCPSGLSCADGYCRAPEATGGCTPFVLDLGTGADGPLLVEKQVYAVAVRAALSATAQPGDVTLVLSAEPGFHVGDEVAIVQMTGTGAGAYET